MTFADKIKRARGALGMTQQELADAVGITKRAVAAYETEGVKAHKKTVEKLAAVLNVSKNYLLDDRLLDPSPFPVKDPELEELLKSSTALFAGGTLSEASMDAFYIAFTKAYLLAKEELRRKEP